MLDRYDGLIWDAIKHGYHIDDVQQTGENLEMKLEKRDLLGRNKSTCKVKIMNC